MSNAIIEQILANADIVQIIGKHVELKRSGKEYKGCCPFHGEKSPSFFVNPQKNLYNCFGCGAKGNALTFLKEYENLTAGEALQELSRQTGIELPKDNPKNVSYQRKPIVPVPIASTSPSQNLPSPSPSLPPDWHASVSNHGDDIPFLPQDTAANFAPTNPPTSNEADTQGNLYQLLQAVCQFYQHALQQSPIAQQYFKNRGVTDDTIATFALGYAPSDWHHLEQAFARDIEGLRALGLVRQSDKTGKDYTLLRHRVIFPIRDYQGQVVGFAGRALSDDDKPKYINSSDSPVFHKQHLLYGLYEARKAKASDWLVVEGYMDVISLYQAGVYGAVASMGTAIGTPQIERLLQLNPVLTLSFDGDEAGQKAAWRAMENGLPALSDGKELRFLTLPDQHDPDSFVKAHGADTMREQICQAVPLSQYLFSILSRRYDITSAEDRSRILRQVGTLTQKLPKGSYGWLLREDIRTRLGLGRRQQARQAQDALINFASKVTAQIQLQLCFLYHPELLGANVDGTLNQTLLTQIYQDSRAYRAFVLPPRLAKKSTSPNAHRLFAKLTFLPIYRHSHHDLYVRLQQNPSVIDRLLFLHYQQHYLTWQNIADDDLLRLIARVQQAQSNLAEIYNDDTLTTSERTDAKAYFILAGLPPEQQRQLVPHWLNFAADLEARSVDDLTVMVNEILLNLMIQALEEQSKTLPKRDLLTVQIQRQHLIAISEWQRDYHRQQLQ
ncbi:DNA primase [Faucicola atlantae]|uniref:DNA primase n=1 Tax=Faucicola atlantae TaxID=34059 RepID=A0A1B8QLF6_9GAMM|nr:CHC2 zinc finger domain-containing protein [Moraxella atlantae]OBX84626.1 DNA primase [Moraxella atlantae]